MALFEGKVMVEGVEGRCARGAEEALDLAGSGVVAVVSGDPEEVAARIGPEVLVDARMLKRSLRPAGGGAALTVGLGPGFRAPQDVDVVVETNRGQDLGRLIREGSALADTGVPAPVEGFASERVLRAPVDGVLAGGMPLGSRVGAGDTVARLEGGEEVKSRLDGVLRGLVRDGTPVRAGRKIGDIDPRPGIAVDRISDKGRAVSGGVLEAILTWWKDRRDE
jgi:xanthine dehydrogenase accessory factor